MDRISTSLSQQLGITSILFQQAEVNQIQQQISLGKRILTPSDDPAASVRLLDLNESLSRLNQFQENLDVAQNRLSLSEGTLQAVTESLQRTRELAVQGFNATNSATDKAAIAEEIFQRLDEIVALANTKDASGDYIYAGFKSQTQAVTGNSDTGTFAFQGDQGQRLIRIGENREISDSNSGAEVFFNISDGAGGVESAFKSIYDLATDLEGNGTSAGEHLEQLDRILGSVLDVRSQIGARLNVLDSQSETNQDFKLSIQSTKSQIEDLDMAEAISDFNMKIVALQAAQQAFVRVQNLSLFNQL